jgi:hypothetical protein
MARATTTRGAKRPAPAKAPARRGAGATASNPAPAPKLSKDELRAQVEKLERTVASLRAKNRELKRASGADAGRAEELERTVARLERKLSAQEPPGEAPARKPARRRKSADIDPGDAVPPGVAVEEPQEPSEEDRRVLDRLNETLAPPE